MVTSWWHTHLLSKMGKPLRCPPQDAELRAPWQQQKLPLTSTDLWLGLAWGLLAIYSARCLLAGRQNGVFLLDFSVFPIPKE